MEGRRTTRICRVATNLRGKASLVEALRTTIAARGAKATPKGQQNLALHPRLRRYLPDLCWANILVEAIILDPNHSLPHIGRGQIYIPLRILGSTIIRQDGPVAQRLQKKGELSHTHHAGIHTEIETVKEIPSGNSAFLTSGVRRLRSLLRLLHQFQRNSLSATDRKGIQDDQNRPHLTQQHQRRDVIVNTFLTRLDLQNLMIAEYPHPHRHLLVGLIV